MRAKRERKRETQIIRDLLNKGLDASGKASRETTGEALLRLARRGRNYMLRLLLICPHESMSTYMEISSQGVIIADTSGLISLFSPDDQNHDVAVKAAERLRTERKDILIPAAVFIELVNILGRKAGHNAALAVVSELTPPFLVLSEPSNLPATPALKKFAAVPQSVSLQIVSLWLLRMSTPRKTFSVLTNGLRMLDITD